MKASRFDVALQRGAAARGAGRFAEAEACYREALAIAPNDPEAISLLGLTLNLSERPGEGTPLLERAVQLDPRRATLRLNLAEGLEAGGDLARAMGVLHTVLASDAANLRAWVAAGDIAERQGDLPGAIEAWNRAHDAHPTAPVPIARLARTELGRGKPAEAMMILDALLQRSPGDAEVLTLWCQCLAALRQWPELATTAASWCAAERANPVAWRHLATAQIELGQPLEAAASWQNAMALSPPTADAYAVLAGCYLHALDHERAGDALRRAAAIDPEWPAMLSKNALLHLYHGRFAEAEDCARRCLAQSPHDPTALKVLSRVLRGKATDADYQAVATAAQREDLPADDRIAAAFAAAQILDARDDADEAFAACEYAQALALGRDRLEGRGYDRAREEARVARLMALSPAAPDAATQSLVQGAPRPIFVVGMPRSGTTLVEAVLGAHSRVFACGERPALRQALHAFLELDRAGKAPDEAMLAQWREAYFSSLPDIGGATHVTDKHPRNLEAIGLIARLFPDARVIIMRRNPVETGLSIFRQEFSKHWDFAHRLADIGHFQGGYARLIEYWRHAFPGLVTIVRYEHLVADFEPAARALVEFCGLDWEAQCLDYASTSRPIATFSSVEVRAPIGDTRRAELYRPYLGPLIEALDEAKVDHDTGALRAHP